MMTIRNISDAVHDALRMQAKAHGRSAEAEVRAILEAAVRPEQRIRMGDAMWRLGREAGTTNEDVAALEQIRHKTPAEPISFE